MAAYANQLQGQITTLAKAATGQILNVQVMQDPQTHQVVIQFDVYPANSGQSTSSIVAYIKSLVDAKTFAVTDQFGDNLNTNCNEPFYAYYPWTDYGLILRGVAGENLTS
jgi:hypothetical protein